MTALAPTAYKWPVNPTWCPGCGNFGIHLAVQKALVTLGIAPKDVFLCFDIGCNGNMSDKIGGYRAHGLHGRVLPLAAGAALANRRIKVIAFAGDGATYGEGVNHFLASFRSNYDITFIVHNNGTYGLTTGQASPTTQAGTCMLGQPAGVAESPIDPLAVAFALHPSFVGRGHSAKFMELTDLFTQAIQHTGFSYIDIVQACPTYDRAKTYDTALSQMQPAAYDITDRAAALAHITSSTSIPYGVLYRDPSQKDYLSRIPHRATSPTELVDEVRNYDITDSLQAFI